ncbi:thioredoxin [Candidatus Woesearchaeota archaeon]|nr:thioredoxin [Candidatus Woesearchaeota archaeon]
MLNLTKNNIEKELKGKIIIDFWADWCYPCKEMSPLFEEISKEIKGLKFAKIDVDEEPEIASRFGVMSIPTFLLLKDGKEVKRFVGVMAKSSLKEKIKESI